MYFGYKWHLTMTHAVIRLFPTVPTTFKKVKNFDRPVIVYVVKGYQHLKYKKIGFT